MKSHNWNTSLCPPAIEGGLIHIDGFSVPAGFPSAAADYMQERIDLNKLLMGNSDSSFFFRTTGDSMIDAHITDPGVIIVDRSVNPNDGDIVLAMISGGWTVKYIKLKENEVYLVPGNRKYPTIHVTEEMEMQVWGVVIQILVDPRKRLNVRTRRL